MSTALLNLLFLHIWSFLFGVRRLSRWIVSTFLCAAERLGHGVSVLTFADWHLRSCHDIRLAR